jgi:hypothetical protein
MYDAVREILPQVEQTWTRLCTQDAWSVDVLRCLKASHDPTSSTLCLQALTPVQQEHVQREATRYKPPRGT